jgi:hypothetical protein
MGLSSPSATFSARHAEGAGNGAFDPNQASFRRRPAASPWVCGPVVDRANRHEAQRGGMEMRVSQKNALAVIVLSGAILASFEQARAIDLTGAWATSAEECKNVFVRKGKANQITFAPMSEVHGGGFIAEPNRLIGRTAKCTIKAKKDDGQTVNIVASCATDIMLSAVQFQLNVVNQGKVRRLFPGMEDMEIFYYRCQI